MMKILTDEEVIAERDRQVAVVADAIRKVLMLHPGIDALALTRILELVGNDSSILSHNDLAAARVMAKT